MNEYNLRIIKQFETEQKNPHGCVMNIQIEDAKILGYASDGEDFHDYDKL
jgi:hypothetical protein